jgi:hypothetical protein
MRRKKVKLCVVLFLGLALTGLQAQTAVTIAGCNASGSGGSVSFSAGQVFYTTNTGTNGSLAQGVQQPYEISIVTGNEEVNGISLQWVLYPNPTTDFLTLKIEDEIPSQCHASLYDLNGKLLENKKMESNEISLDMSNYDPSTYFLKVIMDNKEVKTFKIIKN